MKTPILLFVRESRPTQPFGLIIAAHVQIRRKLKEIRKKLTKCARFSPGDAFSSVGQKNSWSGSVPRCGAHIRLLACSRIELLRQYTELDRLRASALSGCFR